MYPTPSDAHWSGSYCKQHSLALFRRTIRRTSGGAQWPMRSRPVRVSWFPQRFEVSARNFESGARFRSARDEAVLREPRAPGVIYGCVTKACISQVSLGPPKQASHPPSRSCISQVRLVSPSRPRIPPSRPCISQVGLGSPKQALDLPGEPWIF
jgi:hypothetical protein